MQYKVSTVYTSAYTFSLGGLVKPQPAAKANSHLGVPVSCKATERQKPICPQLQTIWFPIDFATCFCFATMEGSRRTQQTQGELANLT